MSLEKLYANTQAIGQQIDHIALSHLPEDAARRYLYERNLFEIQFRAAVPLAIKQRPPSPPVVVVPEEPPSISVTNKIEPHDESETQIINRSSYLDNEERLHSDESNDEFIDSKQIMTDALDNNPHSVELWLQRGFLWQQEGDYAAALSDFLRAFRLEPHGIPVQDALRELQILCVSQNQHIDIKKYLN